MTVGLRVPPFGSLWKLQPPSLPFIVDLNVSIHYLFFFVSTVDNKFPITLHTFTPFEVEGLDVSCLSKISPLYPEHSLSCLLEDDTLFVGGFRISVLF